MGESQSRYSIVERLTRSKLDIIGEQSKLKDVLKTREQQIEILTDDLENWKKDIEQETDKEQREKELKIREAERDYQNYKDRLSDLEKTYTSKLQAIKEALKSIQAISKDSVA